MVLRKTRIIILTMTVAMGLFTAPNAVAWMQDHHCTYPDAPGYAAPAWICQHGDRGGLLTETGYAPPSAAGIMFTRQMALADARVRLAQRLVGRCGLRNSSTAVIERSRLLKSQPSPRGGYYVQLGLRAEDLLAGCRN